MNKPKKQFDPTFVVGLLIAAVCILGGLVLEKGDIKDVTQVTAALIVLGGTMGAVVVSIPKPTLLSALRRAPSVLRGGNLHPADTMQQLMGFSLAARRTGINGLSGLADEVQDPFFKKAMNLLIDGFTSAEIRTLLESEMDLIEHHADCDAKVFDAAGGYAPTIGIIGAVLGLIQVMKHLDQMQEVGRGIAVAFVATVYGVAAANLIFLPLASKMRSRARADSKIHEMIVEGVTAIQEGRNPRFIRQLLEPFTAGSRPSTKAVVDSDGSAALYEKRAS